jgi:reductive dehalogenase
MKQTSFPIADSRFDQKNEMFKRSVWDPTVKPMGDKFYREVGYRDRPGYRKVDYALRNASWELEWGFAQGNAHAGFGLYAWEGVSEKVRHYVESGDPVTGTPAEMSRIVKRAARFYGAGLVGVCEVHPTWVYSHEYDLTTAEHRPLDLPEECRYAVVLAVPMDESAIRGAPTGIGGAGTGLGYSHMAVVAHFLAAFIRGLGYRALPCGNDTALSVPLAMAAGLGEWSRMGLLVTPEFGPRVRLCKVFTDLPLATDTYAPFGVEAFCRACKKCAQHCPSRAIPDGEPTTVGSSISNHPGVRKWYVDAERCFGFWAKNRLDCAVCIRTCPFNKPPGAVHSLTRAVVARTAMFDRLLVRADDLFGYGRPLSPDEFWQA